MITFEELKKKVFDTKFDKKDICTAQLCKIVKDEYSLKIIYVRDVVGVLLGDQILDFEDLRLKKIIKPNEAQNNLQLNECAISPVQVYYKTGKISPEKVLKEYYFREKIKKRVKI